MNTKTASNDTRLAWWLVSYDVRELVL